jgi:hypothetical protein
MLINVSFRRVLTGADWDTADIANSFRRSASWPLAREGPILTLKRRESVCAASTASDPPILNPESSATLIYSSWSTLSREIDI